MAFEIVKVSPCRLDEGCMQVTLKVKPTKFERLMGQQERTLVFKGQGNDWYGARSFTPAPQKIARFLKEVNCGWEFRHLQFNFKRQLAKAS